MAETRVLAEGTLRWVEASGTALTWQTAASVATATATAAWAALSGLMGYVQPGFVFTTQENWATITERGVVRHHKLVEAQGVDATFTLIAGVTGDYPTANTGIGPSALGFSNPPRWNLEFKQATPEDSRQGIYYLLNKAVILSRQHTEQAEGNQLQFTVRALSAVGPTASGYLG